MSNCEFLFLMSLHNLFILCIFVFCLHPYSMSYRGHRVSDALKLQLWDYKPSCGCWEMNLGFSRIAVSAFNQGAIAPVPSL